MIVLIPVAIHVLVLLICHNFIHALSSAADIQKPLLHLPVDNPSGKLDFRLQHIYHHGTYRYPDAHRKMDISKTADLFVKQEGNSSPSQAPRIPTIRYNPIKMQRLVSKAERVSPTWYVEEVRGPNVTDKTTVMSLGIIAENAYYVDHNDSRWEDIGSGFNDAAPFGWDEDGLRGHVFADKKNETVILAIKGTSLAYWFHGDSDTDARDKANDNVLFGCCCGASSYCDCESSSMTCNNTCVTKTIKKRSYYYTAAEEILTNVSKIYPNSDIWMVGHSLGGSVASLIGLAHGLPSVTFEAPGQAMAASRLGLPTPPNYHLGKLDNADVGIWNFGHNADALFLGLNNCLGFDCGFWGYAMQSRCHIGMTCVYNTIEEFGWTPGIGTHGIFRVVHEVIEYFNETAQCKQETACRDCRDWSFFGGNHT